MYNGAMIIAPSDDGNMYGSYPNGDYPVGPGNQKVYKQTFAGIANSTPADISIFDFQWGSWIITGEKLIGTGTTPAPTAYSWLIGRDCDTPYGHASLILNANGQFGDEAGILFGGLTNQTFGDCINLNGTIRVFSIISGGVSILDAGGYAIPGYSNTTPYKMDLYRLPGRIVVYIDDVLAHDIASSAHENGTIWGIKSTNGIYQSYDDIMLPDFYVDQLTAATVYASRHSMVSHTDATPPNAPVTTYTDSLNWMDLIATNSSVTLDVPDTRFGNVEGINGIWAGETPDPWPDSWDTESYTHYLAMAPNFTQNYANDPLPNAAPAYWAAEFDEYAGRVLSTGQDPEMLIVEAAGYSRHLASGLYPVDDTDLTPAEFASWRAFHRTTHADWYVDMIAELQDLRPNVKFRIIPVAQIFCDLVETGYLAGTVWTDYFGDPSPHGTPTYYIINAMIIHRVLFGTNADFTGFSWPSGHGVISAVVSNIATISTYIGNRVDHYQSDPASPYRFMVH